MLLMGFLYSYQTFETKHSPKRVGVFYLLHFTLFLQLLATQSLTGQKATPEHASALLDKRFSALSKKETVVLLVDEVRS